MKTTDRKYEPTALVVVVPLVIILIPFVYSVGAWAVSLAAPAEPFLEMPDAQFEECVRDAEYMRFSHMTLLQTTRDEAIRLGNRSDIGLSRLKAATPVSLDHDDERTYCSDCHTSRERFCNQCHTAVNLNLDCFSCHEYE